MAGKDIRVALVHLGCARNLIDSENILGRLGADGFTLTGSVEDADVAVLNTCSFIGPARAESENAIEDLLKEKSAGNLRSVIVAGCLPEKFRPEIEKAYPDVDAFLGLSDYSNIARIVEEVLRGRKIREEDGGRVPQGQGEMLRLLQTPRSYAYLRPSHGCDHDCAFCIIPAIRGKQRSKSVETVVEETESLVAQGVCEVVLVAEDSTGYGRDLGRQEDGAPRLPELVEAMAGVKDLQWLRVMYAYPNAFPWRLTEVMNSHDNVLPYLDIPVQHISSSVLKRMRRGGSGDGIRKILNRLRDEVPGIALRTTVLVGHPGESRKDFEELLDFLQEFKFERLGAFPYSPEGGTVAGGEADHCTLQEAEERQAELMQVQAEIHAAKQTERIGQTLTVLVDETEGDFAIGRTKADAPEVDAVVRISDPDHNWSTGSMLEVTITGADGYDLKA